jgi:hypothetical protein
MAANAATHLTIAIVTCGTRTTSNSPPGDDPFDSTVQLLSALTLHHGYDDHEAFVASWGGELIRRLRLAEGR